jgi:hypothetical protein
MKLPTFTKLFFPKTKVREKNHDDWVKGYEDGTSNDPIPKSLSNYYLDGFSCGKMKRAKK